MTLPLIYTSTGGSLSPSKMSLKEFQTIQRLVKKEIGVDLKDTKRNMVFTRLHKRLKKIGISSFREYLDLLQHDSQEMVEMVNAVTTNVTSFFREPHHFTHLTNTVLKEVAQRQTGGRRKQLQIWSSGCSAGQEPYTIVMSLLLSGENLSDWDVSILATDINTQVLATAQRRVYPVEAIEGLDSSLLKRFFEKGVGHNQGYVRVQSQLGRWITFEQLNLMKPWPIKQKFDVIFCRNVLIYFDRKTQAEIVNGFYQHLKEEGVLYIGHSESLIDNQHHFASLGQNTYRKLG